MPNHLRRPCVLVRVMAVSGEGNDSQGDEWW